MECNVFGLDVFMVNQQGHGKEEAYAQNMLASVLFGLLIPTKHLSLCFFNQTSQLVPRTMALGSASAFMFR